MTPGDVALVHFPFSYMEEEPFKRRPVLVIGCTLPGEVGDHAALVAQITGVAGRVANPGQGDVVVHKWKEAGLQKISVVRARRLWTPEPRDFEGTVLGKIDVETFEEVLSHVRLFISPQGASNKPAIPEN
ncbi:type II toxin-antitoxin system PemK/MazF family toxin [Streptomyces sp. NPDC093544]|uniref:type II toxin-antitoxin system PemK/MazF family toxin n=1 Tax=Streptomyces sp. NPDC093544 TaxID=3155200 RepID=UPI003414D5E2